MTEPEEFTAPLDRYGPLENVTARDAAMIMVRIQQIRHDKIREYRHLSKVAARKKADAVKLKAQAQLEASGTVEDRKAQAALDSADAFFEAEIASVLVGTCEKSMWVLKDDWDTCRSITANERAERNVMEGYGS